MGPKPATKNERIFLIALTLVAALIRYYGYDIEGYWGDEIFIIQSFDRSLSNLLHWAFSEGQMPLYWLFMRWWHALFGDNRLVLLLPNIVMGALAVPAYWSLTRRFAGSGKFGPVAAAILVAFAPLQVRHSQELRMYPMLALTTAIALIEYHRLATEERVKLRRFILVGLTMGLTHPIASLMLAAIFIATLIGRRHLQGKMLKLMIALAVIGFPLSMIAFYASSLRNISNLISLLGSAPLDGIANVVFLFGFGFANPPPQTAAAIVIATVIAFLFFVFGLKKTAPDEDRFFERLLLVFVIVCLLASLRMPVFTHPRYILFSQAVILPFVARGLAAFQFRKLAIAILAALSTIALFINYASAVHIGQAQWREAASYINAHVGSDEKVILFAIGEESPFPFYYKRDNLFDQQELVHALTNYTKNMRTVKKEDSKIIDLVLNNNGIWLVKDHFMMAVAEKFAEVPEEVGRADLSLQSKIIRNLPVIYHRWETFFHHSYPNASTEEFEFITVNHYWRPVTDAP